MNLKSFLITLTISVMLVLVGIVIIYPLYQEVNIPILKYILLTIKIIYLFSWPFSFLHLMIDPYDRNKKEQKRLGLYLERIYFVLNFILAPVFMVDLFVYTYKKGKKKENNHISKELD